MGVRNANHLAARLIGAFLLGWALLLSPAAPFAADGPNLPSARYVPPPVGTLVKYDDRSYKVVRTEGYLTVFETRKGGLQSWLYAYALFGETADDLYVSSRAPVSYDIDDKNKRMLEAFWPLRVGKSVNFEVEEIGGGYAGAPQTWEITLRVTHPPKTVNRERNTVLLMAEFKVPYLLVWEVFDKCPRNQDCSDRNHR